MSTSTAAMDVAVIGGGLAGLTAAAFLARGGLRVTVFERSAALGGRARTEHHEGGLFNLGPHALYRRGSNARILAELGVPFHGGTPPTGGGYAIDGERAHVLPVGFVSLLTTGLLNLRAKMEVARLLASLQKIDARAWDDRPLSAWLAEMREPAGRDLIATLARVATFTHAPDEQSAGAAIEQLQLAAAGNVLYLDDGWETLVNGLRAAAAAAGARVETAARVSGLELANDTDGGMRAIHLADGRRLPVAAAVMAAEPRVVCELAGEQAAARLFGARGRPVPVQMAVLTVALRRLPNPRVTVAFGIDRPLYYAVHSASARLAPAGGAVIHLGRYLTPGGTVDPDEVSAELEGWLDRFQPGWREVLAARQFLPSLTVTHAMLRAASSGAQGRPSPKVPGVPGLYVAGDWVGDTGQLSDASAASARAAAMALLADAPLRRRVDSRRQEIVV